MDMESDFEQQFIKAVGALAKVLINRFEPERLAGVKPGSFKERILNAKEVCDYYGFSLSTLRRHEQKGLKRMNESLKNKNRMFKFTTCEKHFNQKISK